MTSDNSRTSLDWPGVYQGLIPCADCESIKTRITLHKDGTFTRSMIYQGKPDGQFNDQGKFSWDEGGGKITLIDKQGQSQSYLVGEGRLFHLDQQGQRISGELANRYILIKNPADAQLENKRWVLSELMGQAVTSKPGQKAAFVQFDNENARVSGNSSCNNFFGGYELQEGNRISFGQLGSTMMACPDMSTEAKFLQVLQKVDNYAVKDDTLSLHKARMAPLARFKWVVEQK
jgi:heat shock protein HslJ